MNAACLVGYRFALCLVDHFTAGPSSQQRDFYGLLF